QSALTARRAPARSHRGGEPATPAAGGFGPAGDGPGAASLHAAPPAGRTIGPPAADAPGAGQGAARGHGCAHRASGRADPVAGTVVDPAADAAAGTGGRLDRDAGRLASN